ncbi:MAG TPA: CPBP family intramembrane glutamic endopeptidase [Caulobacteraceae bacterium]|nr:CPBP family intramembrane glutamic endopeptidase [Caulobacteraceae bacterium]
MTDMILDRQGRMRDTPPFLAPVTTRERHIGRLLLLIVLGGLFSIITSVIAVMLVSVVASNVTGQSLGEAMKALVEGGPEDRSLISYAFEFSAIGLSLFAMAASFLAIAGWLYKRPVKSFITAAPRFRWGLVAIGFAVAAPLVGLAIAAEVAIGETTLAPPILRATDWTEAAGYIGVAVVFLFLAALAEEMFFRGWLLQQTSAFTRSIPILLIVNGVLFSLVHGDPDPGAFVVRAAMGIGWCWVGLRLGGLEFATGAHLANNLAVTLFIQPLTLKLPTGEASDLRSVAVQLAIVAVTVAVVEYGLRRKRALST